MKSIKPPQKYNPEEDEGLSIFLAGSISQDTAERWQEYVERRFENYDHITFLNPRRDEWKVSKEMEDAAYKRYFTEQVTWETENLEAATSIFMYFDPNTVSPISLLELGTYGKSEKMMVCCPKEYFRYYNVEFFCNYNGITFFDDLEKSLIHLEDLIKLYII